MKSTILIVDDEAIILFSLKQELKSGLGNDFSYETALNARDALEIIEECEQTDAPVRILITDWLMPGMKGDDFLKLVNERFPDICSILITGHADQEAIEDVKKLPGVHTCIMKPWKSESIVNAVWELIPPLDSGSYN